MIYIYIQLGPTLMFVDILFVYLALAIFNFNHYTIIESDLQKFIQEQSKCLMQEPEQQGLIKSTLEQTLQAIDDRIKFFQSHHLSMEPELLKIPSDISVRTIGDISSGLGLYQFRESPVRPALRDLYTSEYHPAEQYRCVLPPPSEGEDSVNEHDIFQPSFRWISKTIIDSNLLTLEKVEAKRPQDHQVPSDWGSATQLVIYNISKKIYQKQEVKNIQNALTKHFLFSKIKKIRELYYKGKPSILVTFLNEYNCAYGYFNARIYESKRNQHLGENCEIFKVVENRIKSVQDQKWVAVLFRKLPSSITKEIFLDILRKKNISPVWMEDLIEIENYKYTLCKVSYLEDVFEMCSKFQINSPLKDVKVNLHPKSCKAWKGHEDF